MTVQTSFNPRNGLVVPAPAPDTPEAADAVVADAEPLAALAEIARGAMAGAGVTTGPFGIVHGFDAGTRLVSHPAVRAVGFTGSPAGGLAAGVHAAGEDDPQLAGLVATLPAALRDDNPWRVPRRVDGVAA